MDSNIISALIGVGVGWLLSQLTDFVREKRRKDKKIESIYTEVSDVNAWLERMLKQAKYALQLIVLNQRVSSVPGSIHTFIFDEHFHEVCMHLSREARIGLTDCYDSIKTINELIHQLKGIIDDETEDQRKKLCNKFEAIYSVAFDTKFKTDCLLNNRKSNMRDFYGVATKLDKQLNDELTSIAKEAKELGVDGVKSNFYTEQT